MLSQYNNLLEQSFDQWPTEWEQTLSMLSSYEKNDDHFWKHLVSRRLTSVVLNEDNEGEYKAFFQEFWEIVRPIMTNDVNGLIEAVNNGLDVYVINWLKRLSADESRLLINQQGKTGNTALHHAAKAGDVVLANVLINHGADINSIGFFDQTPLHYAAYENHDEIITLLLSHHADYTKSRGDGEMPIHVAAEMGSVESVTVLVNHDKNQLTCCAKEARTPFYIAALHENIDVMQALLDQGDNINQFNPFYRHTIMHLCAISNKPKVIEFLVKNRVNVDILDGSKRTPLQSAAMQRIPSYQAALALIEAGADVNAGNPQPYYALAANVEVNVESGKEFAELLIQKGAIVNPRQYGSTPYDYLVRDLPLHDQGPVIAKR